MHQVSGMPRSSSMNHKAVSAFLSDPNLLDFVEADVVAAPVIEAGGLGVGVGSSIAIMRFDIGRGEVTIHHPILLDSRISIAC
jgi:hypothetical protein